MSPHMHFFLPTLTKLNLLLIFGGQDPEALDESHTEILTENSYWGWCSWDSMKGFHLGPEQKGMDIMNAPSTSNPILLVAHQQSTLFLWLAQYLSSGRQRKYKLEWCIMSTCSQMMTLTEWNYFFGDTERKMQHMKIFTEIELIS